MTPARYQLRAACALGVVLVALVALIVRLGLIQLRDGGALAQAAEAQQTAMRQSIAADRGALLDRHGNALARTEYRPSIGVDPQWIREHDETARVARILREELGYDALPMLQESWRRSRKTRAAVRFRFVRRRVADRALVERLRERRDAAQVRGIVVVHEPVRTYPGGELAAQTVGFTFENDGRLCAQGAERLVNGRLQGRAGACDALRDARGRRIVLGEHDSHRAAPGEDVRMTVDALIQTYAEDAVTAVMEEHAPAWATAGVLDVRTGELLAVACRPTFDPNHPSGAAKDALRNRFFTDMFTPGSTFKPIAMAVALDAGVVRPGEIIDTSPGALTVGRRTIREDKHKDLGELTPAGIIARSSNVGMARVGLRVGVERMCAAVRRFGFGTRTGAGWPAEASGMITRPRDWTETYTLCSVSFGQEIAVTPAQLLSAYGALASDGLLRRPRLFLDEPPTTPTRVISQRTARLLAPMMEETLRTGTARNAARPDYRIAGKTGTAEKKRKHRGVVGYVASFACFAPVENPRLAVLVVADQPAGKPYGSLVAAPYATDLITRSLRYLGVPPSAPFEPDPLDPHEADGLLEVKPR